MNVYSMMDRATKWVVSRFGQPAMHPRERCARLLEEVAELCQAEGMPLVDYIATGIHVFNRPVGEPTQEAAGVSICLLLYCSSKWLDLEALTETELRRIEGKSIEHFRARHQVKVDAGIALEMAEGDSPPETASLPGFTLGSRKG